ncbi:MAG: hypothetical protein HYY95_09760 [Candidatus Rokubacteria bacterium]|nr:hypothetical protein [Candidatus Rokubacteria bacterium]MBI3105839.1 hypothetical protein [Candidatus Rokubacteria bacterium]
MSDYLKGNYELDAKIEADAAEGTADAADAFERKALSRLGGSICFVSKKRLIWKGEPQPEARRAEMGMSRAERGGEPEPEARRAEMGTRGGEPPEVGDGPGPTNS